MIKIWCFPYISIAKNLRNNLVDKCFLFSLTYYMCKKLHNPIFNELKGQLTLDKNDYIHEKKTLGK